MGKKREEVEDDGEYFVIGPPLPKSLTSLSNPDLVGAHPVTGILEQRRRQKRPLLVGIVS